MPTTLKTNTAHRHDGRVCKDGLYFAGDIDDPKPTRCPDAKESPLLPYIGKSREEPERPRSGKLQRPQCEFKGAVPHPASPAYRLVWDLQSGTVAKWSCAAHRFSFGGNHGYWVSRVEGYEDNGNPRTHELCAPLDPPTKGRLGSDDEPLSEATCVDPECGNPARRGEFCDECQSRWENGQAPKSLPPQPKVAPAPSTGAGVSDPARKLRGLR
jgi:hypothetical protein